MAEESVVNAVRGYLERLCARGVPVRFGVIYSSWACGTADEWSDIDLLVVSPQFDAGCIRVDIALLWEVAARYDSRIEPVPCGEKQWQEDDSSAIVEIGRRAGELVAVSP